MFLKGLNALGLNLTERNFPIVTENCLVMWELVKHGLGIGILDANIGDTEPRVRRALPARSGTSTARMTHNLSRTRVGASAWSSKCWQKN